MYLVNKDKMGIFQPSTDNVIQEFQVAHNTYLPNDPDLRNRRPPAGADWLKWPHIHGTPIYHRFPDGRRFLYVWPEKDYLKVFERVHDTFVLRHSTESIGLRAPVGGMPGGLLSLIVNSNDPENGILFASLEITPNTSTYAAGRVYAFDAANLELLWENSNKGWQGPVAFGQAVFPPGAPVAMSKQSDTVLAALAVDDNGALNVAWLDLSTNRGWQGPVAFGRAVFPPGAPVAMSKQSDTVLAALAVDDNGA